MPRFYFHLHDGTGVLHDREGEDLPDLGAAMLQALDVARSLIAADINGGTPIRLRSQICVANEYGQTVGEVMFRNAINFDDSR